MSTLDDYDLLYRVAHHLYVGGYSQIEISEMEHLSRPQVSRLISRAKELGMIKVEVLPYRDPGYVPVEEKIQTLLGISEVHIFPADVQPAGSNPAADNSRYISSAASWLSHELPKYSNIGIAWSQTIYRASLKLVQVVPDHEMCFTPLIGNAGISTPWLQANSILDRYAASFGAKARFTQCSMFTSAGDMSNPLEAKRYGLLCDGWKDLDAVITGIGARPDFTSGYLADLPADVRSLMIENDPVGDIFGRFFDAQGRTIEIPDDYVLAAMPLEQLREVPHVICLASGADKAAAIAVASRCGYINTLIIDETAADAILAGQRSES